eukprot:172441-Rhodomonas_salina.1
MVFKAAQQGHCYLAAAMHGLRAVVGVWSRRTRCVRMQPRIRTQPSADAHGLQCVEGGGH